MGHILWRCNYFTMNDYVVLSKRRVFKFCRSASWVNRSVSRTRNWLKFFDSRRWSIARTSSAGGLWLDFWVRVNLHSFFFYWLTLWSVIIFVLLSLDWCLCRSCLFDLLSLRSSALFSRIIKGIILRNVFPCFVLVLLFLFFIKLQVFFC